MSRHYEFVINGVTLIADVSGALYRPDKNMLIVADLHFEKASAFAARGVSSRSVSRRHIAMSVQWSGVLPLAILPSVVRSALSSLGLSVTRGTAHAASEKSMAGG